MRDQYKLYEVRILYKISEGSVNSCTKLYEMRICTKISEGSVQAVWSVDLYKISERAQ